MNRKGFSLVEMAIVLVIFGMVLASASSILTLFVNKGGAERTRKMIETNKNALFSIAAGQQNPYLMEANTNDPYPYPANFKLSNLPYPQDAYGRDFLVIIDSKLGFNDDTDKLDYSPICGASSTGTILHICKSGGTAATACDEALEYTEVEDVAFVLVSGSVNKNIQTALSADGVVTVYYQGTNAADDYDDDLDAAARPEKYDDIVDWVTLSELRVKAGCDPMPLDFMDTSMPVIQDGARYEYSVFIKGGVPYVDTVADDTLELYSITLDDILKDDNTPTDDLLNDYGVEIKVMPAGDALTLNVAEYGNYLSFDSNGSPVAGLDSSYYRVIIKADDNDGNSVTRTLYIKRKVD